MKTSFDWIPAYYAGMTTGPGFGLRRNDEGGPDSGLRRNDEGGWIPACAGVTSAIWPYW